MICLEFYLFFIKNKIYQVFKEELFLINFFEKNFFRFYIKKLNIFIFEKNEVWSKINEH